MQGTFKKAPDVPVQHAQIDMSMAHDIKELESFQTNEGWQESKVWTLKHEFPFKVHVCKIDHIEGFDVSKALKLLGADDVVVKAGVWIDVCETPG